MTVSRNGRGVLSKHLALLVAQTRALNEIIVVDNASTDGTRELLRDNYPSVTVIGLPQNEGVSGGYAAGLAHAVERGHDWIWMLDQDSSPSLDAIEVLLSTAGKFSESERLGLIAPLPFNELSGTPYSFFLWRDGQVEAVRRDEEVTLADMVISSGSLIRAEAVVTAGLPRRDLFMDFVDYEHCLRLRRHGFLIGVAGRCVMAHRIGHPRTVKLLGKSIERSTHASWRDYYKVRNRAFVVWHLLPSLRAKLFVMRQFVRQLVGALAWDPDKLSRVRFMWRGLRDGIRGRLGITVRPE